MKCILWRYGKNRVKLSGGEKMSRISTCCIDKKLNSKKGEDFCSSEHFTDDVKVSSRNVVEGIDVAHNTVKLLEAVDALAAVNNVPGNSAIIISPKNANNYGTYSQNEKVRGEGRRLKMRVLL